MTSLSQYARLGPPLFVDHLGGPPVMRPEISRQCWGLVPPKNGMRRWCRCDRKASKGKLVCAKHARHESAARALDACMKLTVNF